MFTAIPLEVSPVSVALAGAFAYGGGDFAGGRAALRLSPSGAVALAQCAAMVVAVQMHIGGGGIVAGREVVAAGIAGGIAYAVGLLLLYQGIAHGRIGVVAPVCGVVGILVPLAGDFVLGRALSPTQLLGIAICALAILLLAGTPDTPRDGHSRHFSFRLGALSGMGYGTADLCLGMMAPEDGTAAFMVARSVAAAIAVALLGLAILRAGGLGPEPGAQPPRGIAGGLAWVQRPHLLAMLPAAALAVMAGVLDSIGHMSYVHVATQGSMAVASALVALFPAVVVVLAVVILRERIVGMQYLGLATGLAGVLTISL